MNPLKAKQLLPEVALELNQDLQLVEDLSEFFWDHVHKNLASLSANHIQIHHLGTFHTRRKFLRKLREKSFKNISPTAPKTFQRYAWHKSNQEKVAQIDTLLDDLEKEYSGRVNHNITKRARKHQAAIEKQEEDLSGDH